MHRGKIVILLILVVAVGLASFAWWHRWRRSQQVLTIWGSEAADTIRTGEKVELFRVGGAPGAAEDTEQVVVDGKRYVLVARRDISAAAGLIHARHHLLHEQGFAWDVADAGGEPTWDVALRFTKGPSVATLLLDFSRQRARLVERQREVSMAPIAESLKRFIADLMPMDPDALPELDPDSTPE